MHEELAAAEGVDRQRIRAIFILLLAVTIAVAMKIVGVLLVMAFLVVPAVTARPLAATPERMVVLTALVAGAERDRRPVAFEPRSIRRAVPRSSSSWRSRRDYP